LDDGSRSGVEIWRVTDGVELCHWDRGEEALLERHSDRFVSAATTAAGSAARLAARRAAMTVVTRR
jgi:hypothetical protein